MFELLPSHVGLLTDAGNCPRSDSDRFQCLGIQTPWFKVDIFQVQVILIGNNLTHIIVENGSGYFPSHTSTPTLEMITEISSEYIHGDVGGCGDVGTYIELKE